MSASDRRQDRILASLRTDTLAELCGLPSRQKESIVETSDRDALAADVIRHLVADTWDKLDNENMERQYLLEDLLSRLLTVATHLDGREPGPYVESAVAARHAYPLRHRAQFGDNLAGRHLDPGVKWLDADDNWRP